MAGAYYLMAAVTGLSLHYLPIGFEIAICAALALVIGVPYWRRLEIRKYLYAQATDRNEAVDLRIDETGYYSSRPGFNECRMTWRCFTGWKEGKSVFVLGRGIQMCIVPKKPFSSDQQVELRSLLTANVTITR